jgi:hypothetical protein
VVLDTGFSSESSSLQYRNRVFAKEYASWNVSFRYRGGKKNKKQKSVGPPLDAPYRNRPRMRDRDLSVTFAVTDLYHLPHNTR